MRDPTARFSDRFDTCARYRPGYPDELLLRNGNRVYRVEPNAQMRLAAEQVLPGFPLVDSREGGAEDPWIERSSVASVTAASAFHRFDPERAGGSPPASSHPGGESPSWGTRG